MIRQLAADLRARRRSPVELAEAALAAIARTKGTLNTFITVDEEGALAAARRAEESLAHGGHGGRGGQGAPGPLTGIPIAHKDLIATKGLRTTAGSRILGHWVPRRDATVVRVLADAGAVSLGKTNTHEFAFGTTNDNPHYGATGNPWNPALTTGGSSGGSAAAVSAGILPLATGTDTAGSIRIPAALCGVVGLKPTYGLVPTRGIVPLCRTVDTAGPIAATVEDAALGLEALTGVALEREERATLRGLRIGVPEHYVFDKVDPEIEAAVREALAALARLGAEVRTIEIPVLAECFEIGVAIVRPEALAFHSRWYPARAGDYGEDVARSLEMAQQVSGAVYVRALERRRAFSRAVRRALGDVDLLAGPTVPLLAFENRVAYEPVAPGGELPRYALTRLTYPYNLSRLPAISVPCGLSKSGLPIGLQLAAGAYEEALLLAVAGAYERARGEWPEPPVRRAD
jgi:aspartyl-tRNA(Asn)/glutamyl-tRNA(Gln) amidotransferase subunit A